MCVWERESRKERDSKNWEMWWENICNSSISITTHSLSLRSIFVLLTCFLCYYSLVFVSPSFSFIQYFLLFAHCWSAATKCIPFKLWIKKKQKNKEKIKSSSKSHKAHSSKVQAKSQCIRSMSKFSFHSFKVTLLHNGNQNASVHKHNDLIFLAQFGCYCQLYSYLVNYTL